MAELNPPLRTLGGARLAWGQFGAIAWLRWRIFVNIARRKGGKGELIARILLYPLALCLVLGPAVLAGFFAWFLAMHGSLQYLNLLFWAAFGLTQLLNINLSQPGTTFDPVELIRFPMALRNYVLVRLCFGLLSPANVVISLMSLAIFVGFTVDRPQIWPFTLLATTIFALANVLFSRMIFAWVDRWLSTRRAREAFTALIFAASLGFQYINVTYNPGFNHNRQHRITPQKLHDAQVFLNRVHPWLSWLPPELTAGSLSSALQHHAGEALRDDALVALYAATFLAIYSRRMRSEYHGENLSDQANAVRVTSPVANPGQAPASAASLAFASVAPSASPARHLVPPTLAPLLGKEFLLLRRNTGLLYGVIAPVVMVFLFAGRLSLRGGSHWLLLVAVAYAMLGLAPQSYNSFGLEGTGAQFYFMAPVPLREVFFAKNVMHFGLALFEVLAVLAIVANVAGRPHPVDVVFVLLWAVGTLLLNTSLGNLRSIAAPKKVNPGRTINRSQSQVSAWMAMGVLAGTAALAFGLQTIAVILHKPWLSLGMMAAYAVGALIAYQHGLRGIETYAMQRRDPLFEELGKKT